MNDIKLTDDAKEDLRDGVIYYEDKQAGLGQDFIEKVEEALERIRKNPKQFPKIYKDVRKTLLNKFPHKVLFVTRSMQIIVFAVFHSSRNPQRWKNRKNE